MKLPKYIACIANYYETNPDTLVMYSLVITRSKDNAIMVSRSFDLDDYSDEDACDELDAIVGDFKERNGSLDVVFGENPIKLDRSGNQFTIRMITANDYLKIMKVKEKDRHGMYGLE